MDKRGTGHESDDKILARKGYQLRNKLGEGAYAKVYLSIYTHSDSEETVKLACKIIDGEKAPKDFITKFFPREVEVMRKIRHKNLVRIHSIIIRKHKYFIFMQYAQSGDMLEFIQEKGCIKESQARVWFSQIINGMTYLHGQNICHRDLKCENLLLTDTYAIKVSDFGFAREWKVTDARSKTYCGSVSYCPPEIIGGIPYNPIMADCWSMGVILYVMVNKSMPFDDSSLKKMYDLQVARNWQLSHHAKKRCSKDIKNLIHQLLEPIPPKRPTCKQMGKHSWIVNKERKDSKKQNDTKVNNKISK